jgi:hypothetical protein
MKSGNRNELREGRDKERKALELRRIVNGSYENQEGGRKWLRS